MSHNTKQNEKWVSVKARNSCIYCGEKFSHHFSNKNILEVINDNGWFGLAHVKCHYSNQAPPEMGGK